ncbi:hypothetical protein J6590_038818 [Homalodisca vitripennis]|nr:hypothetical protein J6590_038818 [Homalodisca vitripennis]
METLLNNFIRKFPKSDNDERMMEIPICNIISACYRQGVATPLSTRGLGGVGWDEVLSADPMCCFNVEFYLVNKAVTTANWCTPVLSYRNAISRAMVSGKILGRTVILIASKISYAASLRFAFPRSFCDIQSGGPERKLMRHLETRLFISKHKQLPDRMLLNVKLPDRMLLSVKQTYIIIALTLERIDIINKNAIVKR